MMVLIDSLCYRSRFSGTDDTAKVLFGGISLLLSVAGRDMVLSSVMTAVFGFITVSGGGIPVRLYLKLLRVPLIFLLLSDLGIILQLSSTAPVGTLFQIPMGTHCLWTDTASLLLGLELTLTAFAAVSCLYFIALSTPVTGLLTVLRRLHCPRLVIELMLLIYRFLFLVMELAQWLNLSRVNRMGNGGIVKSFRSFGLVVSSLMVKCFQKTTHLFDAMESRCYTGTIRVLNPRQSLPLSHVICGTVSVLLFSAILIWRKLS